jgi:hypothetical protein
MGFHLLRRQSLGESQFKASPCKKKKLTRSHINKKGGYGGVFLSSRLHEKHREKDLSPGQTGQKMKDPT